MGAQESVEIKQLPIKAYLDQQLMPLLLEALAELAKEKPEEPIEFVAKYLLDHNPEKNWAIEVALAAILSIDLMVFISVTD